jgi:hypothetical protein
MTIQRPIHAAATRPMLARNHDKDGKSVDAWNVYDELSLVTQAKLARMAKRG